MWALKVKAYLAPNDHARVIRREIVGNAEIDPIPPDEGDDDYAKWVKSEQVALGLIIGTATDLHFETCHVCNVTDQVTEVATGSRHRIGHLEVSGQQGVLDRLEEHSGEVGQGEVAMSQ